jgi:clan AA aspartic protease (TIGR02281 family)
MNRLIIIVLVLFLSSEFIGQPIYTKDMVYLGSQDDVLMDCIGDEDQNYWFVNNRIINKYFYCKCLIAELIPKIRFIELQHAIENNKMEELLLQKKYFKVIDPCMKYYANIDNAYSFDKVEPSEKDKQLYINICIESIAWESFLVDSVSLETKRKYCECEVNTMIDNGYSLEQIFEMEKEDSEVYNEVVIVCLSETMAHLLPKDMNTGYDPRDIRGDQAVSNVKLIDYLGYGYKLKITIGGVTKYYVFDTGATYLVINSDLEKELIAEGTITPDSYKGETEVMMANNESATARTVELNDVTIGDYTINNVTAIILDDGALLCGMSLLNKFRNWDINNEDKTLDLYK